MTIGAPLRRSGTTARSGIRGARYRWAEPVPRYLPLLPVRGVEAALRCNVRDELHRPPRSASHCTRPPDKEPALKLVRIGATGHEKPAILIADRGFPDASAVTPGIDPGDVVNTGTPAGVGQGMTEPHHLRAGDVVAAEIIGTTRVHQ